jgi:hypothetical protein
VCDLGNYLAELFARYLAQLKPIVSHESLVSVTEQAKTARKNLNERLNTFTASIWFALQAVDP